MYHYHTFHCHVGFSSAWELFLTSALRLQQSFDHLRTEEGFWICSLYIVSRPIFFVCFYKLQKTICITIRCPLCTCLIIKFYYCSTIRDKSPCLWCDVIWCVMPKVHHCFLVHGEISSTRPLASQTPAHHFFNLTKKKKSLHSLKFVMLASLFSFRINWCSVINLTV